LNLLDDLAFRLTRDLLEHPLFNRFFKSLEDFKAFSGLEVFEFETFLSMPMLELEQHFEELGKRLHQEFNPPFIDVLEVFNSVGSELVRSALRGELSLGFDEIKARHQVVANAVAKSYFHLTLGEIGRMANQTNEPEHSPLQMHFDWLGGVVLYLKGESEELPEVNHLACRFAHWLSGLQSELLLFSAGAEREGRLARITLLHRRIHEQLGYILSFIQQKQYILAYSHLARLYHTVLQLDQQVRSLQMLYKENEEALFYDFIRMKSEGVHGTYYFVSIRIKQIIDVTARAGRVKSGDIESLRNSLHEIFEAENLDSVVLLYEGQIAVFFKAKDVVASLDVPEFMEIKVHRLIEKYALERNYRIKSSGIGLDLVNRYQEEKIAILKQLSDFRLNDSFTFVTEADIDELYELSVESRRISRLANQALNDERLTIFYQPIFSDDDQCKQYVEVLVRAPIGEEFLEAEKFIHFLEQEGRMVDLDRLVLRNIRKHIPRLKNVVSRLSVNIYPSSFNEQTVMESLIELASELRKNGITLIVEITEHLFLQDLKHIEYLVHDHGIVLAMDDFGSGYSNLLQLIEYSERGLIKILKIDGNIVKKIDQDETVYKILQTIIQIAKTLNLAPVVMEYVYNEQVHKKLSDLSVPLCYQGFYLCRPLPLEELIEFSSK
jgi:EAL domain-containing protein (putative c-di-GMP-specific phosphodiesterase class I)